jgi:hypothetical protein
MSLLLLVTQGRIPQDCLAIQTYGQSSLLGPTILSPIPGFYHRDRFMESQKQIINPKCMVNMYAQDNQKMNQRSIGLYFSLKRLSARAIHEDLVPTLGTDAVAWTSVTRYFYETHYSSSTDTPSSFKIPMAMNNTDQATGCHATGEYLFR